jgi:hypothetical protein
MMLILASPQAEVVSVSRRPDGVFFTVMWQGTLNKLLIFIVSQLYYEP